MNARARRWNASRRREGGFSYIEVLATAVLVGLVFVPALDALRAGVLAA